jgi:hypothetical protein
MVLSLWYIYSEGKLWCATQKSANWLSTCDVNHDAPSKSQARRLLTVVFVDEAWLPYVKIAGKRSLKDAPNDAAWR